VVQPSAQCPEGRSLVCPRVRAHLVHTTRQQERARRGA
jgi:hypothetical protein